MAGRIDNVVSDISKKFILNSNRRFNNNIIELESALIRIKLFT